MNRFFQIAVVGALVCGLSAFSGCATPIHKPTTAGNAATSALVAYAVVGYAAGQYLALPLCGVPAVMPCKTQVVNDKLVLADTAAYTAAKAADAAGNAAIAAPKLGALEDITNSSEVQSALKSGAK